MRAGGRFALTARGGLGRNHRSTSGIRAEFGMPRADAKPRLWDGLLLSANRNEENRTVKKTAISLVAVATLGLIVYLGGYLHAQNQSQPPSGVRQTVATAPAAPLRTRIAVVNLQQVIKQYRKWNDFEQSYNNLYKQYDARFQSEKAKGMELKTQLDKATDETTKERVQQQIKDLERQVQDLGEAAKKQLGKMRDDQAQQIYQEVEQAVQAYARANDIEMVLHFNDAVAPADYYHPLNVQRKLQTAACLPMYLAPGMNITDTIATMLNQRLGATSGAPSGPR
jgi:Skp family chaperone for outer membrane proteins